MALTSSEIAELTAAWVTAAHIAVFEAIDQRRDEAKRSKNRECVRKFRERHRNTAKQATKQPRNITVEPCNITPEVGNITSEPCNITSPECNITSAKSLKVSRNFKTPEDLGETYKEGGKGRKVGPLQSSLPSVEKTSSDPSAVASASEKIDQVPAPTKPVPTAQAQSIPSVAAQNPKSELFALARELLGSAGGGAVSKLLKLHGDDVIRVRRIFELAKLSGDAKAYVFGAVKRQQEFLNRDEIDRKQVAEWRPQRGKLLPPRDYSDALQRFYIPSKIDGKKLWMRTERVFELHDEYCLEHDIVSG